MTKKTWILLYFLVLSCFTAAFGQITSGAYRAVLKTLYKKDVPLISCEEASKLTSARFLDTRAYPEFKVSHISEAQWVGYEAFSLDKVKNLDKGTPIVVYCSVGVRSEKIGRQLIEAGFTHVQNLYGSLFEWVNQGYPVVDMTGQPTQKVHAYSPAWGMWLNKGEKVYE
jgi:rhodanese-related sulfurtransferase